MEEDLKDHEINAFCEKNKFNPYRNVIEMKNDQNFNPYE